MGKMGVAEVAARMKTAFQAHKSGSSSPRLATWKKKDQGDRRGT